MRGIRPGQERGLRAGITDRFLSARHSSRKREIEIHSVEFHDPGRSNFTIPVGQISRFLLVDFKKGGKKRNASLPPWQDAEKTDFPGQIAMLSSKHNKQLHFLTGAVSSLCFFASIAE